MKTMEKRYLFGISTEEFISGLYFAGIGPYVFYLNGMGLKLVFGALFLSFIFAGVAEIIFGILGDILGNGKITSFGLFLLFCSYGSFFFIPLSIYFKLNLSFLGLSGVFLFGESCRKAALACISGAFDAWAINRIKQESKDWKSDLFFGRKMKTALWSRFSGAIMAGTILSIGTYLEVNLEAKWMILFGVATISMGLFCFYFIPILLSFCTHEKVKYNSLGESLKENLKVFQDVGTLIKNKTYTLNLLMYCVWYCLGCVLLYSWPVLFRQEDLFQGTSLYPIILGYHSLFIFFYLMASGIGQNIAAKISKGVLGNIQGEELYRTRLKFNTIFSISYLVLVLFSFHLSGMVLQKSDLTFFILSHGLFLLVPIARNVPLTFIMSLLHAETHTDKIRATSASLLEGVANFMAAFLILLTGNFINSANKFNDFKIFYSKFEKFGLVCLVLTLGLLLALRLAKKFERVPAV